MNSLTAGDFARFFQDVHGCEPFPWQQRLAELVLGGTGWPSVVDLPTGTGKTALLDIAVFALAAKPTEAPRRIVFVIDRRIVVDQVCERAEKILGRIQEGDTRVLGQVRRRIEELGGGKPLGVAALRGGIPLMERGHTVPTSLGCWYPPWTNSAPVSCSAGMAWGTGCSRFTRDSQATTAS